MEHPIELTAESLWDDVSARLRGALNEKTFGNWFSEVDAVSVDDDAFVLAVPNDFTREWIEGHFVELIRAAIKDATGTERRLRLTVARAAAGAAGAADARLGGRAPTPPPRPASRGGINPKYTFDSFVIGSSNRFAHAAALAVAEAPAQAYNPLFIYGHTGLGKTHLLHAVANYVGAALLAHGRALRHLGDVRERLHQLAARQADRGVQAALPRLRRAPDRRRPVLRAQGADPGGVLPHLQLAPRGGPADRDELRPAAARHRRRSRTGCARASSGG